MKTQTARVGIFLFPTLSLQTQGTGSVQGGTVNHRINTAQFLGISVLLGKGNICMFKKT